MPLQVGRERGLAVVVGGRRHGRGLRVGGGRKREQQDERAELPPLTPIQSGMLKGRETRVTRIPADETSARAT